MHNTNYNTLRHTIQTIHMLDRPNDELQNFRHAESRFEVLPREMWHQ